MAKFVLTITSDDPQEIASFLSPQAGAIVLPPKELTEEDREALAHYNNQNYRNLGQAQQMTGSELVAALEQEPPKRRGRPPKAEASSSVSPAERSTTTASSESETQASSPSPVETADTAKDEPVSVADVITLINRVVKEKSAKAAVQALTDKVGTPSPNAMNPGQLAYAKTVLEELLNG